MPTTSLQTKERLEKLQKRIQKEQVKYEAYSYSFYVKVNGRFVKCFDLNVSEDKLLATFAKIEKKVSKERSKLEKCWTNMTMVIDSEGNMKTAFDYTDLSRGNYQYKKAWKKKYID